MVYKVELEVFEGPFDLLLELILKQEVDIYEVPIAAITNNYLKHLTKMEDLNLEITSEFLVIAATLIELKSLALLPSEETGEVEEEIFDTREQLITHLIEYKTMQNVSEILHNRGFEQSKMYHREAQLDKEFSDLTSEVLEGVRLSDLALFALEILEEKPSFDIDTSHIYAFRVSLAEKTDELLNIMKSKKTQMFKELCQDAKTKIDKIIIFLALLELMKRGDIIAVQAGTFGGIKVKLTSDSKQTATNHR